MQNYTAEARQEFVDAGGTDYQLDWFGIGDWANYTGVYPTGSFYIYVADGRPRRYSPLNVSGQSRQRHRDDEPNDHTARPVERCRGQPANLRLGAV